MSGVVIASSHSQIAQKLYKTLQKYFPSSNQSTLHIKNKYFDNDVKVNIYTHQQITTAAQKEQRIDCLIFITSKKCKFHQVLAKNFKLIQQKTDPISQVLLIDEDQNEDINLEQFYQQTDSFIQSLTFDIQKEFEGEVKQLPKSLMEDTEGILRLVQIINQTSWRAIKKQENNSKTAAPVPVQQSQNKNNEPAAPISSNKVSAIPPGVNLYSQQKMQSKIQKDMNHFAAIMEQMLSLKGQNLSDSERKDKAADIIMKLALSMENDQNEDEFGDFEE